MFGRITATQIVLAALQLRLHTQADGISFTA